MVVGIVFLVAAASRHREEKVAQYNEAVDVSVPETIHFT
jgi:hypothetical protein